MEEDLAAAVAAAVKIQAALRGYNVRKRQPLMHLRSIDVVRRTLGELQGKAADPAYIERICVDVMECRKLTEGIMAMVLQLDALQDIHPIVRGIRKSVNREVVQFMELIDAVVVGAPTSPWQETKNNPNMGRSNSMSHIDPIYNHSLKRMHSLDNFTYPEQANKRQHDARLGSDHHEWKVDMKASRGSVSPYEESDLLIRNSGQEGMIPHSELEALRNVTAAVIIQSSFRGYVVRRSRPLKHLRNIADVRAKLRELTVQVSSPNFHSKLRFDKMERLRVTECITALLLRLDSVQGVDHVIRDIRKSITGEVFKLQELVDKLISNPETVEVGLAVPCKVTESDDHGPSGDLSSDTQCCSLDMWSTERGNCAGEDVPLHSLSLYNTGHERLEDEIWPKTPECDQQRNHMDLDERSSCQTRESDGVQLSSDRYMQGNSTKSLSNGIAERNGSGDYELGPCVAIVSDKVHSSQINDKNSDTISAVEHEGVSQEKRDNFQAGYNSTNHESVVGGEQVGNVGSKDSSGQLEEENIKLRALLHQVLMFAEMQSSMVSKIMETNERLEGENARYRKREKRSKNMRKRSR